ncbi:TauD/TfdA dioxygenase family protein [Kitasatospora sp. NPDC003701]
MTASEATLLYSVITPGEGGETRFADATRAYAALPADLRERVDGLSTVHSAQHLGAQQAEAADGRSSTQSGTLTQLPEVTLPLAPVHPATGARALLLKVSSVAVARPSVCHLVRASRTSSGWVRRSSSAQRGWRLTARVCPSPARDSDKWIPRTPIGPAMSIRSAGVA